MISVVIACKTRRACLDACLAQLERQTYRAFDVYVVGDAPLDLEGARAHVLASGPVPPNRKRALGAAASAAEIVAFIDDDAYPDPAWLATAVRHFGDPSVVAVGGPGITPPDDGPLERASGAVFASPFVTASVRLRYVAEAARNVDALAACNMLIRRDVFLRDADATAGYWSGEEILTCLFAVRDGGRIVYDPAALVFHHRRRLFAGHLRQAWNYGRFRGFFLRRFSRSWRNAIFAVPAAFVLAHLALPTALARPRSRVPTLLALGSYAALVAWSAQHEARTARANPLLVALGMYLTHLTYGVASIAGFMSAKIADDR